MTALTHDELRKLVGSWMAAGKICVGPVRVKPGLVLYARLASPEDLLLDGWVRPANSIKELLLPRHEVLYGYRVDLGPYRPYEAQSLPGRLAAGHRDSPCRTCTSLTSWK